MSQSLLPTRFLFRFSAVCKYHDPLWTAKGAGLDETYRLVSLAEMEGRTTWADVRAAWSEAGLAVAVRVEGKKQPPWGDPSLPEQSDGLHLWIDTRDIHNVHRASRFCHRFAFLAPDVKSRLAAEARSRAGGRRSGSQAAGSKDASQAMFLPINRAREQPRPVPEGSLQVRCQTFDSGYALESLIPAEALTGFDPAEHPRLGFTYSVLDRELGEQTFGVGSPMPYREDPSLWATLELAR
ncbi:MAG: hypothetical protein LLG00_13550 [Planctomycetaceae bacterium]|nr:hypothetical protein [Planctomycetaceae bacterium]